MPNLLTFKPFFMTLLQEVPTPALNNRLVEIDFDFRSGVSEEAAMWLCYEMNAITEEIRCRQLQDNDIF